MRLLVPPTARRPRGRGNIDHLAVGPWGVKVIDAKRYRGRIDVECGSGLLHARTERLIVGGRERTKVIDGVIAQSEAVRRVLADGPHATAPVQAVLCFVDGDWPLLGRLEIRRVPVLPPRRVSKLCAADGPLDAATTVTQIAETLAAHLPPA